ncbi:uncharacterized protein A4U43_C07F25040 [Asparagus officinalis]|uniref:POX domain-containing protein n=2 Tax=Asparagus officinalis TaxID=4686 RepID=A0A5P1EEU4_ASPOF|nr:BEL1-like homeodomain protein 6 isoform X2 [Asparagus officinalis]XP_020274435.1 BEL1-like homeodomain protein 6 isoform X2 [Asparagus officinalis]XP_020274436.1 BEL1-like homeodomain protein 6 isoform X2 [Asparagus officinalis]XP_020274437.1 BEL1-like homeodomain protein 6 isoform X2 [Asparagus officinalis]XP_020274439.1 BEL1-like homeodomain protein 6 isoform X2 [Asparagus officinalis]ONK64364.1 uncharacterized protein A4U43_C07F25040 [Asparagus officinalis]
MLLSSFSNHEARKDNTQPSVSYGNGHGLSLTLCSRRLTKFQRERNSNYSSNDCMICEREANCSHHNLHGMTSLLAIQNSPYLKPAQQLLDEVICVSNAVEPSSENQVRSLQIDKMEESINRHEGNHFSSDENDAVHIRISKLVALLVQLESQYERYFHQMDTVVASFEAVAGVEAAASYTALTIQAMSKHFSNLRCAIITQINSSSDSLSKDTPRSHGDVSHENSKQKRETLQQLSMMQIRQVWRPLKGLPEESVACLRSWLFKHFLHPYRIGL